MIVCVCKAINDRAIRRAVAEGCDSFDALQFELGVGTCCGKCVQSASEVLFAARCEAEAQPLATTVPSSPVRLIPRPIAREVALA